MQNMIKKNLNCRICKGNKLTKVISLGEQPLANGFLKVQKETKKELFYPLDVYFCHICNLLQLRDVVNKEQLFRNYVYFTSGMPRISRHFQNYAEEIMKKYLQNKQNLIMEIGSNDGILLKFFQEQGYRVLGVDPAKNIAEVAKKRGITTWCDFFGEETGKKIREKKGKAQVIIANNVVAHINDHQDLMKGIQILLKDDGVFVMEAPYLLDMFENLTYDTIYHEHLSYLAVRPLQYLTKQHDMEIFDVSIVPTFSQSIRVFMSRKGRHSVTKKVNELVKKEEQWGLNKVESYQEMAKRIEDSKDRLINKLKNLKQQGKKIAAYGAPAKGNTLLNYGKIGLELIDYALDHLPSKQGLFSPGLHIPVVDEKYAQEYAPDYYLLLAWNYLEPILEREQEFRKRGGKFIIPVGDEIKVI